MIGCDAIFVVRIFTDEEIIVEYKIYTDSAFDAKNDALRKFRASGIGGTIEKVTIQGYR